jgi:hypothetical protein
MRLKGRSSYETVQAGLSVVSQSEAFFAPHFAALVFANEIADVRVVSGYPAS